MKRALIDLSSVIWTCLRAGKDTEHGTKVMDGDKEVLINSAGYGYDNAINHLTTSMKELHLQPYQLIFVEEGMNSKDGRRALFEGYKGGKGKAPEWYVQFNECKRLLLEQFLALGSNVVTQDGVESDDVIGYLAQTLKGEVWIITNDKDLAQCIGGNVHLFRMGLKDTNPFGPFDPKYIPVAIALMGDDSDKIPGAKGYAEKSFQDLLVVFGEEGLGMMETLIKTKSLGKLAEDVGELKSLQKIIDSAGLVYTSYELGRLRTEHVNTMYSPLRWTVGMVKPRSDTTDTLLKQFAGSTQLISKDNYADAFDFFERQAGRTPLYALDIETSTPPESDEWLERQDKEDKIVDVFGSELTGLSVTFGANLQYTYYITHEHVEQDGCTNVSLDQVRDLVNLIPREKITWVHNAQFELPVLYNEWGADWAEDPEWHGFLRNVRDTRIASSYVDENHKANLKALSERLLGYKQQTYAEVTTLEYRLDEWGGAGKELARWREPVPTGTFEPDFEDTDEDTGEIITVKGAEIMDLESGPEFVRVQHKMNELTAAHVTGYGADDAICTAALANHFQAVMEIEDTDTAFHEVETLPAYVTALGFVQGIDFSLEDMAEMVKDDDEAYEAASQKLNSFLMKVGFEGTVCPVVTVLDPASIKLAFNTITGQEFKTAVRTQSKLVKLLLLTADQMDDEGIESGRVRALAMLIENNDLDGVNRMMKEHFVGDPKLELGSAKKMRAFLYDCVGLPVQIVNDVTPKERANKPDLANALYRFKSKRRGKKVDLSDEDLILIREKAKTDDIAIDYALAFDADSISEEKKEALACVQTMKKVMTRRSLFYKNYWGAKHWKDGKIHPNINQCAAVTRRYSSSGPNVQQWPKKGEAVRFRGCVKPHKKNAVVCSIDYTGQELRLAAERSQDKNMLACYIGENLKDIHSITAASAMRLKWGDEAVDGYIKQFSSVLPMGMTQVEHEYRLFLLLRKRGLKDSIGKLADDLRKDSKNVNFTAQFGGQAQKLSETLIMKLEDAQLFLDARSAMFPDVDVAAKRAAEFAEKYGYALTMMKARRHLRNAMMSDDKFERSAAARQSWNMEIQGSGGEMIKIGMGRLWKSGALFTHDVRFIAPVHDELVVSAHKDDAVSFLGIMHKCMTGPYADMKVPILGSISLGPNFAEQTECGDDFIAENIQKALDDIFHPKEMA